MPTEMERLITRLARVNQSLDAIKRRRRGITQTFISLRTARHELHRQIALEGQKERTQ